MKRRLTMEEVSLALGYANANGHYMFTKRFYKGRKQARRRMGKVRMLSHACLWLSMHMLHRSGLVHG